MAVCKYCGEKAGWFSDAHPGCVTAAQAGREQIISKVASTIANKLIPPASHPDGDQWSLDLVQQVWSETKPQLDQLVSEHHLPADDVRAAFQIGWSTGTEQAAIAGPMHPDRLVLFNDLYLAMGFTDQEMRRTDGYMAEVFSTLLWGVMVHGEPSDVASVPHHPFNLRSGEVPIFFFGSVTYSKETISSSYQGGYGGMSVRLARGVYYHFGGFQGHRTRTAALKEIDYGGLLVTTQNMYFGGEHATFRIPYDHVVSFRAESSGIGLFRDTANAKAEVFTVLESNPNGGNPINGRPVFGWFLFNIAHFLAQPEARALYAHS